MADDAVLDAEQADTEIGEEGTAPSDKKVDGVGDKKADEKKPDVVADKKVDSKSVDEVIPETYDLKMPAETLLQKADVERLMGEAKELGLTNAEAQEYMEVSNRAVTSYHEAQLASVKEIRNQWVKEAESDKEIGGDKFKENIELAKRVIDKFGSDTFKKTLDETGFGNHPEVIRIFTKIGRLMSEDRLILATQGSSGTKPMEDIFYGGKTN